MPYRRLPNTDQARIRALKAVIERADMQRTYDMAVSFNSLMHARNFLAKFESAQIYYAECYARQSKAASKHLANAKVARLYISHFIQVLNLSAIRGEIKPSYKELYGLDAKSNNVPDLASESAMVEWGRKIIEGENKRTSQGGIPIYNPTIAKVKVHYDIFKESSERQKNFQMLTARSLEKLAAMREEADALILDIWNQVEKKFEEVTPNEKRLDCCRAYGLVYYYRTGEKKKEENV